MSFSHIQGAHNDSSAGVNTITATGSAVASNSFIIGAVAWGSTSNNVTGIKTSAGDTFNTKDTLLALDNESAASFILGNIQNGPNAVTVTFSANDANLVLIWDEFSGGLLASDPSDVHHAQPQSRPGTGSNAVSSGSATPTQDGDLIWGCTFDVSGSNTVWTAGTGFTLQTPDTGLSRKGQTESQTQTTAASIAATYTGNQSGGDYMTFMIAVKAAPPPAGVPYNPWPQMAPIMAMKRRQARDAFDHRFRTRKPRLLAPRRTIIMPPKRKLIVNG